MDRLTVEANLLSDMNFDIVYESVGDGYGLTLPIQRNKILVVWLSNNYPNLAPSIYETDGIDICKIEFAPEVWRSYYNIKDIVLALNTED